MAEAVTVKETEMTTETTPPLFEEAAKYVSVDIALLRRIVDASDNAPTPSAATPRAVAYLNNAFTGDYVGWGGCGHWYQWRDCIGYFADAAARGGQWCPACLVDEIGRAEVTIANIDEVRAWIREDPPGWALLPWFTDSERDSAADAAPVTADHRDEHIPVSDPGCRDCPCSCHTQVVTPPKA
jgi:hypothetical protein